MRIVFFLIVFLLSLVTAAAERTKPIFIMGGDPVSVEARCYPKLRSATYAHASLWLDFPVERTDYSKSVPGDAAKNLKWFADLCRKGGILHGNHSTGRWAKPMENEYIMPIGSNQPVMFNWAADRWAENAEEKLLAGAPMNEVCINPFPAEYLAEFKKHAPRVPIGIVEVPMLSGINEQHAGWLPFNDKNKKLDKRYEELWKPYAPYIDYACGGGYLVAREWHGRDLLAIKNGNARLRKLFPGKPIYSVIFTRYTQERAPGWTPENNLRQEAPIGPDEARDYLDACLESSDGVIVWNHWLEFKANFPRDY